MSKLLAKRNMNLKLTSVIPQAEDKSTLIRDLFNIYHDKLIKYYDTNKYIEDCKNSSKLEEKLNIGSGNEKTINLISFTNRNKYAVAYTYSNIVNDIKIHLNIIEKYFQTGGYEKYNFKIPLIYYSNNEYVMELIEFTKINQTEAKTYRIDNTFCKSYGQFINFCINVCNYDIKDVESYIDKDNILYFLDFGSFKSIQEDKINIYKSTLINDLKTHCKKYQSIKNFSDCEIGIKCIIDTLETES